MRENKRKKDGGSARHHAADDRQRAIVETADYELDDILAGIELDDELESDTAEDEAAEEAEERESEAEAEDEADEDNAPLPYSEDEEAEDEDEDAPDTAEERAALEKMRDGKRKLTIALTVIAIIVIIIGGAITAGGYMVTTSAVNFPNLYVDGVFVGGLDKAAAQKAIEDSGWEERAAVPLTVTLMDRCEFNVEQYASGAMMTVDEAAESAFAFGHTGNWYANLFEYAKCLMRPVDIAKLSTEYDREYILAQCDEGIALLNETLGEGGYEIDKEKSVLRMEKGAGELKFDKEDMAAAIINALGNDKTELSYSRITGEPKMPDFKAIHAELEAEPADAYFSDDNKFTVIDEIDGCDFDPNKAESIWADAKPAETVEIPIKLTFPEVTGEYLRSLLFRDKLGSMTTYFPNSNENRISNIKLACSKIEGIVLYPGDVFSYNDTLGQRTEEAGFKMAGAYANGEVIEELGGGICQVSSTLYSATLYAYQVSTVQRFPHYFPVDYMEKGYDATVSWPKPDYQFENDREYPIKIVTHCDEVERSLTVEIWGTNLDGTYIELTKDTYSYNNAKYPWIMEGYGVQMHRNVFDANGIQIDRVSEVYDVYHTHEATEQIKMLDAQAAAEAAANGGAPA